METSLQLILLCVVMIISPAIIADDFGKLHVFAPNKSPVIPSTAVGTVEISALSRVIKRAVVDEVAKKFLPGQNNLVPLADRVGAGLYIELDESWDPDVKSTVLTILNETADVIYGHMKDQPPLTIKVRIDRSLGPIALYNNSGNNYETILLDPNPQDYRPQLMYQFAHEFCHVISDHNRLRSTESQNQWLHETFCELASIFVLHSFEEPELRSYVDDYLEESISRLEGIAEFSEWMVEKEDELRGNTPNHDRETNAVVAYRMLPIFKQFPELWNTFPYLPKSESRLEDYLDEWSLAVASNEKKLISLVRATLLLLE